MPIPSESYETAQAAILKVQDTNKRFNDGRLYLLKLTLEVRPNNRAPFQTEIERVLTGAEQSDYWRNAILEVRFHPKNPKQVFVVQVVKPVSPSFTPGTLRARLAEIKSKADAYTKIAASPDGNYAIVTTAQEMKMSHWVEMGALWDLSAARITQLGGSLWSVENISWSNDSTRVTFTMRRYPGDAPDISIELAPQSGSCKLRTPFGTETVMLSELSERLELYYRQHGDPAWWH